RKCPAASGIPPMLYPCPAFRQSPGPAVPASPARNPACGESGRCYNPPAFDRARPGKDAVPLRGPPFYGGGKMRAQLVARGLVVATTCLAVCALTLAQQGGRNEWLLLPQLARGQEFTYSGWFTEERSNGGVRAQSSYRLESTLLVLGGNPAAKKWDVAFLTVLSRRSHLDGQ